MGIILFSGCSVTKHLPEGEVLYTGGKTVIQNKSTTPVGGTGQSLCSCNLSMEKVIRLRPFWVRAQYHWQLIRSYDVYQRFTLRYSYHSA